MKDDLIGIKEDNIKKAYKNGCEEVRGVLKDLFPSLELGAKAESKYYLMDELTINMKENLYGQFIRIQTPGEELTSACHCKDEGNYIWVPFYKSEGMRLSAEDGYGNFKILKDWTG